MKNVMMFILCLILAAAIVSCGGPGSPQASAEKMKTAACKGDVGAFFEYIDKDKAEQSLKQQFVQAMQMNNPSTGEGAPTEEQIKAAVSQMIQNLWTAFEEEVKKKDQSIFCTMKVAEPSKDKPNQVSLVLSTGQPMLWDFTKEGKKWKMTGFGVPEIQPDAVTTPQEATPQPAPEGTPQEAPQQ